MHLQVVGRDTRGVPKHNTLVNHFYLYILSIYSVVSATPPQKMRSNTLILASLATFGLVAAHPGHSVEQELAERQAGLANSPRSLNHCAAKIKARGIEARNVQRRANWASLLGKSIAARDADSVLATDHNATSLGYSLATDEATLFSTNNSCVLAPIVTQGPYYVEGEYIRTDIVEDQAGIARMWDSVSFFCSPEQGCCLEFCTMLMEK